ncbi:hypothetical protein KY284_032457 [Solanum tuberosum]|nr:hypothetical protein KY284_032457 [Solanum tuberosum]
MVVSKWNQHLTAGQFVVKTDQKALKFLLEQKLHTGSQLKWIAKLMQFYFIIEYKKGKESTVVDALSRLPLVELAALTLSTVKIDLLEMIKQRYTILHGQLRRPGKLVIGADAQLRSNLIQLWHDTMVGGHSGIENTYKKLTALVYWKGLRDDVHAYVKACDVCQKNKYDNASINMDFIDGLPRYKQKIVIWVVVDRLTKYAHFVCLAHPYSAHDVVSLFLEHIYKLHGVLEDIVNDRDLVFTSKMVKQKLLTGAWRPTLDVSVQIHKRTGRPI